MSDKKSLSPGLWIGIFFLPFIFAWLTLRQGYSKRARLFSFGWLFMLAWGFVSSYYPEWIDAEYRERLAWERTVEKFAAEEAIKKKKAQKQNACRQDQQCWGDQNYIKASRKCAESVERRSRYEHRWIDRALDAKFALMLWKDKEKGVMTYVGDKIEFSNGFGAFAGHIYECDYDTLRGLVVDTRINPGRL